MQYSNPDAGGYGQNPYPYSGSAGLPYVRQRRRGRGCVGCLGTLLVIVLLGALAVLILHVPFPVGSTVIPVSSHPQLILESQGVNESVVHPSSLYIHAGGPGNQIIIKPARPLNLPFGFPEFYQESGDQQTVIYNVDSTDQGVFDITVPTQTDLEIDTNDLALQVVGVTGQMSLTTNSGSLTVKNCRLSGSSLLRSNRGAIVATQDQLSGSVAVDNNSADITFQGSLDSHGNYHFTSNGHGMTLSLPLNVSVHVDAITNNQGTITSSFPNTKPQKLNSGSEMHADIGASPRALLSLYNNGGSITVNAQGGD